MRIKCPYCGERALEEFTYRGDATVTRPKSLEPAAADACLPWLAVETHPANKITKELKKKTTKTFKVVTVFGI